MKTELVVTLLNVIIGSERKSNKWMKLLFGIPLIEVELEEKRRETEKQNKTLHLDAAMFFIFRFCVGDRFFLCDNKILCEYDYEERMVFANLAYNSSNLAQMKQNSRGGGANGPSNGPSGPKVSIKLCMYFSGDWYENEVQNT